MVSCEICGVNIGKMFTVNIEGSILRVCQECAKFGTILSEPEKSSMSKNITSEVEEEIVPEYASMIKSTRASRKLSIEEFAKSLNEKATFLKKIEEGRILPPVKLAKCMEKKFGIKLIELRTSKGAKTIKKQHKSEPLTIGNVVKVKD